MRKHIMIPSLLAVGLALTACSNNYPNADLERARADFIALQNNPLSNVWANAETTEASDMLEKASKAQRENKKPEKVSELSYLVQRRVDFANATIALRQQEANKYVKGRALDIAQQTGRGQLVTLSDVLFATGQADIKPSGYATIDKIAAYLKMNPERNVMVEGYTDSTGGDALNMRLSQARAESVAAALADRGVPYNRITTRGYGKAFPIASNSNATDRALNRRVEVTISQDSKIILPRR